MNIQAVSPQADYTANLSGSNIKCGNEFENILQQVNDETDIAGMKKFLEETFNINVVVTEYSCEKTDSEAEIYDTSMLDSYDMSGGRNVVISKKSLLRMKRDGSFRQKVYKSIKDIPWSGKTTGGTVKSNGVFIHEDGTGGYYLEFDWGEKDEGTESRKARAEYSGSLGEKNLNTQVDGRLRSAGYEADTLLALMGAQLNYKKEKQVVFR